MPCNTDYMEPTAAETHRREAANHLIYAFGRLNDGPLPSGLASAAADLYGGGTDKWVKHLCTLLREMTEEQRERVVYDAKDKRSRALADWWEEHCRVDEERERIENIDILDVKSVYAYATHLDDSGEDFDAIGDRLAKLLGTRYDADEGVNMFYFPNGVILMTRINGFEAWCGERL